MLTIEWISSVLEYAPETGLFLWKINSGSAIKGGKAGSLDTQGYRRIGLGNRLYKAHRLAWYLCTGNWPKDEIDHINGNRDDNRIANLRQADRYINTQNASIRSDNSTGFAGVSFYKPTRKWKAQIGHSSVKLHLGYFDSPSDAHAVYVAAKMELHPGFCARAIEAAIRSKSDA
jgi:hypothetical protein